MTRLDDAHPQHDLLLAFGVGRVHGEAATAIEEHLSRCSVCCDSLARPQDDELIRLVRTYPDGRKEGWPPLRLQRGYEVIQELGRGGMGVVYKARQAGLGRLVALKRARPGGGAEDLVRFRREAEAAARLRHPNIVQIFEVGEQDGLPYLAMEYVEGGTLAGHLGATPAPPRVTAELVRTVALAVHYAHQNGVVHRDLKPENILLCRRAGCQPAPPGKGQAGSLPYDWDPKVADFGLAKLLDEGQGRTRTGAVLGTPRYMAPEQATGAAKEVGPATDVHALGVVLYEMLTGRVPFAGATALDTLEQVRAHEPAPPRRLHPGVPRDLETICLKALEKAPARRYASAAALAEDLARYLEGRPILARPTGAVERLVKAVRRRPARAALVGLAALTAFGAVVGAGYHNARLREQVERADRQAERAVEQKERADAQYHQAQQTLVRMLDSFRTQSSGAIPLAEDVQRAQREHALAFFEGVVARQDDPDPRQRADLATASREAARLQIVLGKGEEAERNLRRAIRLLEGVGVGAGDDRERRTDLASCYTYLGVHLHEQPSGRAEAAACGERAVQMLEALARDFPKERHLKHNLAQACNNLATIHRAQAVGSAVALYERSLSLNRELHRADPGQVATAVALAETGINLGPVYLRVGKPDKAAAVYQEALAILEPLAAAHPKHVWYASSLTALRINLAGLRQAQGRHTEALALFDQAVAWLQGVLSREPDHAQSREHLLHASGGRAQTLSKLGRHGDSLKDWDRVVALAAAEDRPAYRLERAGVLIQAGEYTKAAAEADEVAGAAKAEGVLLCAAGALHAQVGKALAGDPRRAEGHAVRAVGWLRKARDAGFFQKADHAGYLKDEDFASLRPRDDFQRLLREVAEALPKGK